METEKIIFFRNFLFRTFIVGVAFAVIYSVITLAFWNTWLFNWAANTFKVNETELGRLTLSFFMLLRIIIVFGFLAPCIALHWMVKKRKSVS